MGAHFIPRKANKKNLCTLHNAESGYYKQLDYLLIRNKQRNWVTQTRTKGTSNINSNYQHQLVLMEIRIRLKRETVRHTVKNI